MAANSFIFNSRKSSPGGRFPTALLSAFVLVALLEILLRLLPPSWLLGYDQGLAAYYDVRHHIEAFGSADIAVVGSSRGREAIVAPELRILCESGLKRSVTVSNYSVPDASANEIEQIVQRLLTSGRKPAVIVYLASPRILRGEETSTDRRKIISPTPARLPKASITNLPALTELLSVTVIEALEEHYLSFRHRFRLHRILSGIIRGRIHPSPVKGGLTDWQKFKPNQTHILSGRVTDETVARYVEELLDGEGNYALGETRIRALKETVRTAREAGVGLVLAEAPVSDILRRHYPPAVYSEFYRILSEAAREGSTTFVTVASLPVKFGDEDFREQSHVNKKGGVKLTRTLGTLYVLPALRQAPAR